MHTWNVLDKPWQNQHKRRLHLKLNKSTQSIGYSLGSFGMVKMWPVTSNYCRGSTWSTGHSLNHLADESQFSPVTSSQRGIGWLSHNPIISNAHFQKEPRIPQTSGSSLRWPRRQASAARRTTSSDVNRFSKPWQCHQSRFVPPPRWGSGFWDEQIDPEPPSSSSSSSSVTWLHLEFFQFS